MVIKINGLPERYYLKNIIVAFLIALIWLLFQADSSKDVVNYHLMFSGASVLLYPYSRFLYGRIISYVVAENKLYFPAILFIVAKVMTLFLCWFFSILIAPVSLAWLYYSRHDLDSTNGNGRA